MKLESLSLAMIAAVLATSCANEELVDVNPDVQGNALHFSPMVGHSRAVETKLENLGDFAVVAKGIHPHGGVYANYLIGGAGGGAVATRQDKTKNIWNLADNVYWPSAMDAAVFWAYTASRTNESTNTKTDVLPAGVTFGFDANGTTPTISGFSPVRANLSEGATADYWNDGDEQVDLLVSFKQQNKSESASNVDLIFEHALSQITVKAKSANKTANDHRIVKIKGAWIVNTKDKANLSAGFNWEEANRKATANTKWDSGEIKDKNGFSAYGSFYKQPKVLEKASDVQELFGPSSLMLIPQELEAWKANETDNGAYILLLCRVELKHEGTAHTGSDTDIDDVKIHGNNHYHQQFPVNKDKKFVEEEYGFACVPVASTWQMGKKYEYTLDICGAITGAGIYPPDFTGEVVNKLIPTDKSFTSTFDGTTSLTLKTVLRSDSYGDQDKNKKVVGDPVLDAQIQFSVKVTAWEEDKDWNNGSIGMQ